MIRLVKPDRLLHGTIHLPLSKSMSNRLLILQYLHPGRISVPRHSAADDTVLMETLLKQVGDYRKETRKRILTLNAGNSGTVMRFMTAFLAAIPGSFVLSGDARMSSRPVMILVEALKELGADIRYLQDDGYPPLFIKGRNLSSKDIRVDAAESSQHISALLLLATSFADGLSIHLEHQAVSRPYITMTCKLLEQCGFPVIWQQELIRVFPGKRDNVTVLAEPDWSSASFWYGMMSLAVEGMIRFPGLQRTGMQGDEVAVELFSQLGVRTEEDRDGITISRMPVPQGKIEWDFRDCPDLAVPAIVACALVGKEAVFRGLEALRIKESDRLQALREELAKMNGDLLPDYGQTWKLKPARSRKKKIMVRSYADHRMVMAMMLAAMKGVELEINDPEVVSKSYPGFWRDVMQVGFVG